MNDKNLIAKKEASTEEQQPTLIKVAPEQVSANWEFFGTNMATSFPPIMKNDIAIMSNILESVMLGELTIWCYCRDKSIYAIISTHVWREPISSTVDFFIYSFTALERLSRNDWKFIRDRLGEYARSNGCKTITAFTENDKIARFLESQGAEISTLIRMEV